MAPALPQADQLRELRRPHRAGAGAGRGARLDGRRGDHRRPHVHPLLPHDPGRARADGERRRADRARRPARRRALQRRPRVRRPGRGRPAPPPARARRREDRARVGRARSTSPPTRCPSSGRSTGRASTTASATPGTAPGRAGSAGGCSRRSRSAATTNGAASRSCGCRRPSLPPEPLKRLGGGIIRSALLAVEDAQEQGRRGSVPARVVAALPRLLRMPLGTR